MWLCGFLGPHLVAEGEEKDARELGLIRTGALAGKDNRREGHGCPGGCTNVTMGGAGERNLITSVRREVRTRGGAHGKEEGRVKETG